MFSKVLVFVVLAIISFSGLSGCRKSSSEAESEEVKSMAEYEAEAKEQINEKNVDEELEKLEKEIEQDISQE